MKIWFSIILLLHSLGALASVYVEVNWTTDLRKVVSFHCEEEAQVCESLCGNSNQCDIPEGACRDCVGTSLGMTQFFTEIGRTIVRTEEKVSFDDFLSLITTGSFVTISPNDVYNVIDAAGSIRAMKKFEKLCPEGSLDQLVFVQVEPLTRRLSSPHSAYCLMDRETLFLKLDTRPETELFVRPL